MSPTKNKKYWGTQRVARVLQVTTTTVASWIDQGLLKGHKTPTGRRRVDAGDLVAFLRAHRMAVPRELKEGAKQRAEQGERDVVLVVEDDPGYLKAFVKTLERAEPELELVTATNGVDALLEIGRVQPSLIVLDYRLPDLNAVQVIERLLEPGRKLQAEVVVVTGGMPAEAEQQLRRAGVKTIVNKAEGMPVVVDAIRQALRRQKVA